MMDRMKHYFNLDSNRSKMIYIYNPLSKQFYDVNVNYKKDNYFLMVGRLDTQKGYKYIIEALNKCRSYNKDFNLKILGDGRLRKSLETEIEKYGLNVELLGNVKDVINYYSSAKALILTSVYEGFPNVLLEALSCGCPIISFDCPTGPSEIITKSNGILVEYLNVEELTKTLLNFDNIKWDYKKVAESAKKYKNSNIIDDYIKEIENI